MDMSLLKYFLPTELLERFEIKKVNEVNDQEYQRTELHIDIEEKKEAPDGSIVTKLFKKQLNGYQIGGYCANKNDIIMNKAVDNLRQRIHEIFHTFFFNNDYADWGIGSYKRNDFPNRKAIDDLINNDDLPAVQLPSKKTMRKL